MWIHCVLLVIVDCFSSDVWFDLIEFFELIVDVICCFGFGKVVFGVVAWLGLGNTWLLLLSVVCFGVVCDDVVVVA